MHFARIPKHRLHTKLHFFINWIENYHLWRSLFSDYNICGYTLFRPWWNSLSINPPLWWKDADFYSPHGIHPQTPTTHLNNLPIDVINWVLLNQQGSLWEKYELSSISSSSLFPLPSFHFFFVSSRGIHVSCIFGQLLPEKYRKVLAMESRILRKNRGGSFVYTWSNWKTGPVP